MIDPKDGAIAKTSFVHELHLKLGAKVMIIHNIETADMLTNGQRCTLKDLIRTSENTVNILVIELYERKAGENNRKKKSSII